MLMRAYCVVSMTERPFMVWLMNSHMRRLLAGSMPVLGSSRNTMGGLPMSARPTLSLRLLPPL